MKKPINICCGSYLKQNVTITKDPLPANPKIAKGIAVIYIGAGNATFTGTATNSLYYASDHSRHFRIYIEDKESILKNPGIMLKP